MATRCCWPSERRSVWRRSKPLRPTTSSISSTRLRISFSGSFCIIESVDPAVKSLADLRTQPEFGRFDRLVKSGMAISDAYKLACFDRLGRQQAAAARQAAINDVRAKEHLAPVGGGQAAEDGLTDEIIRNYRQYNPRWTRAQIAAFHRSYKQGV